MRGNYGGNSRLQASRDEACVSGREDWSRGNGLHYPTNRLDAPGYVWNNCAVAKGRKIATERTTDSGRWEKEGS